MELVAESNFCGGSFYFQWSLIFLIVESVEFEGTMLESVMSTYVVENQGQEGGSDDVEPYSVVSKVLV